MTADFDAVKAEFEQITGPYAAERVSRATANIPPLPNAAAERNRAQIAASRRLIVNVSRIALAGIGVWVLLVIAKVTGWL